jgi:hypothetical protein
MKKVLICTTLLLITATSFCQQTDSSKLFDRPDYLQKSKNQKAAALVLLIGGGVLDIIGLATFPKDYVILDIWGTGNSKSTESKANTSAVLLVVGTVSMLASIPLFISSHVNHKRAISLGIDTQQFRQLKKTNFSTVNYPALTMKIRL